MKPLEIAARYAAFAWYTNCRHAKKLTLKAEARRFSNRIGRFFFPWSKRVGGDYCKRSPRCVQT